MRITAHDDRLKLLRGVDHAVRQTTVGKFAVSSYALIDTNGDELPGEPARIRDKGLDSRDLHVPALPGKILAGLLCHLFVRLVGNLLAHGDKFFRRSRVDADGRVELRFGRPAFQGDADPLSGFPASGPTI